ncbi:aldehyde dehydrogenase family 3 member B1-like protein [Chytriomyces sp. MP71]|nr:aldehyde dehydrogenase family 3 member B1-like protein [Chytriomyces sp. MP71]
MGTPDTHLDDIPKIVGSLHSTFATGKTKPAAWRRNQLKKLYNFILNQESILAEALYKDLKKDTNAVMGDINTVSREVAHTLEYLDEWMKPDATQRTLFTLFDNNMVVAQPKGVVLIIGAWNYPFLLTLGPMVCALAAGNCIVLKPSEVATHSEAVLVEWLPKIFDTDAVKVVTGGVKETTVLLQQKFDHIFYTGNGTVGKIIMEAAAKHLTPVTLELGGKSPVYIHNDVNVNVIAKRLMWGKLYNAGQTCIGPDYLLVHKDIVAKLTPALRKAVKELYSSDVKSAPHYGKIINENHTKRLANVLERQLALPHSSVVMGGEYDVKQQYVAPLIVSNVRESDPLMEDELFGPLLPIITVENEDKAIKIINSRDHPLCLYVNTNNKAVVRKFETDTRSGTISVNDYLVNMVISDLPFGGVGPSGMGAYHGEFGFRTFSHQRAMVWRGADPFSELMHQLAYPPFSLQPIPDKLLKYFTGHSMPSDAYVAFKRYVPLGLIVSLVVLGLAFEIGRRVGRGGPFFT